MRIHEASRQKEILKSEPFLVGRTLPVTWRAELAATVATMALSQSLGESPFRSKPGVEQNQQDAYNERHRLALEELLSGGVEKFFSFLQKEKIPNFLSDDEIQLIRSSALSPPRCVSFHGDDQETGSSTDCSSVTYFPEVSDVEPPMLENGWPGFTTGSYRGVTRAVAHFQPSYGESIYSCKEAARRLIKNAKEVIAIVTDSLTDLDVFKDLQEACSVRKVPVYILLDQLGSGAFLKMCKNVGVCLDDLRQMRVRTITGSTYYMRSGARMTGKVHERFMLIDGIRVATGSYRFNWTDGKLNSSNLIELSGQIAERFDEQFRILYAHSLPVNTGGSVRNIAEQLHLSTSSPCRVRGRPTEQVCLTSTPTGRQRLLSQPFGDLLTSSERGQRASVKSNQSTIGEDWSEDKHVPEEILAGSAQLGFPQVQESGSNLPSSEPCHMSTQTSLSAADSDTQTDLQLPSTTQSVSVEKSRTCDAQESALTECIQNLSKERRQHYANIRSKVEHMMSSLSRRRGLADITNMTQGSGALRVDKDCGQEPNPQLVTENMGAGTWPGARCVD
ncbi:LOW QUALITY PROTEIN: protein FAM83D [Neosynchiropus ocellatus]